LLFVVSESHLQLLRVFAKTQPPVWEYLREEVQRKHLMAQKRGIEPGAIVLNREGAQNSPLYIRMFERPFSDWNDGYRMRETWGRLTSSDQLTPVRAFRASVGSFKASVRQTKSDPFTLDSFFPSKR